MINRCGGPKKAHFLSGNILATPSQKLKLPTPSINGSVHTHDARPVNDKKTSSLESELWEQLDSYEDDPTTQAHIHELVLAEEARYLAKKDEIERNTMCKSHQCPTPPLVHISPSACVFTDHRNIPLTYTFAHRGSIATSSWRYSGQAYI